MWFLAENVGGLKSANEGKAFDKILADLKAAGYRIYPHLYKFEDYGIPQARHRVIIIGIREDLPFEYKVPSPAPYKDVDNTCKTAIEVPPIATDAFNNELTKQNAKVVERLSYIKPGENAFTAAGSTITENVPDNALSVARARQTNIDNWVNIKKPYKRQHQEIK